MQQLTQRQLNILEFIRKNQEAGNKEITEHLKNVSRFTVVRDIRKLLELGLVKNIGTSNMTIAKLKEVVGNADDQTLIEWARQEREGKARKGALKIIEAALADRA